MKDLYLGYWELRSQGQQANTQKYGQMFREEEIKSLL